MLIFRLFKSNVKKEEERNDKLMKVFSNFTRHDRHESWFVHLCFRITVGPRSLLLNHIGSIYGDDGGNLFDIILAISLGDVSGAETVVCKIFLDS